MYKFITYKGDYKMKKYLKAMNEITERKGASEQTLNADENHVDADAVLCSALKSLGYNELVEAYHRIFKWYS